MSKSLTIGQRIDYNERLRRLKSWVGDSLARAEDLKVIRDRRLYQDDYKTFESFVEGEFGIGRGRAYQLLDAQEVMESLGEMSTIVDNEGQARALKKVPLKKRKAVVRAAAATGTVTAKSITAAAKSIEVEVVQPRDKDGYPIPGPALPAWNRREEMVELAQSIRSARTGLRALDPKDVMLVEVNLQDVIASLSNALRNFKQAIPEFCCSVCQGQTPKTCAFCKGRGVVSEFRYKTCTPSEVKVMRGKAIDATSRK